MSISSSVSPRYATRALSAVANAHLYTTASAKSSSVTGDKASDNASTVVTLSNRALDLMQRRQVSEADAKTFKDILTKANVANAEDPKTFLQGLSAADMEVLRKVHSLADPINISSLSNEGAANLLAQPGSAQDLNNDGLTAVGAGYYMTFPPRNAPESFKTAWASATSGMSELDVPMHLISAVGLANIGLEPGDPRWRNPYADPGYDYRGAVDNVMSSLQHQFEQNMISFEQYQHDRTFYGHLLSAMG